MRNLLKGGTFIRIMLAMHVSLSAQKADWNRKTTRDGRVQVLYKFTESTDEKGKNFNVLEYEASTTAKVSLERCKAVMMNDPKHMEFMEGTERVRRVRDISDREWITYYFLNSRWPMPDADLVTRYTLEEDGRRGFILTGTPAPEMLPETEVARMKHNHSKFTFADMGNGEVRITMYSKSIPLVSVPKWLISTWIPDGPADMLNGIIRLAGN